MAGRHPPQELEIIRIAFRFAGFPQELCHAPGGAAWGKTAGIGTVDGPQPKEMTPAEAGVRPPDRDAKRAKCNRDAPREPG